MFKKPTPPYSQIIKEGHDSKSIKMKNRYFLVSFNFNAESGHGYGTSKTITDGLYLNEQTFIDQIKEEYQEIKIKSVIILNIIELSEQDFNQYTA